MKAAAAKNVRRARLGLPLVLFGSLAGFLGSGCLSSAHHLGAATTPAGVTDVGVSLNTLVYERGREHALAPNPELTFRRGVNDKMDWGGRLSLFGLELGTRHQLHRSERWAVALAPTAGLWYVPVTNNSTEPVHFRAGGTALVDLNVSERVTLTAGTSLHGGVAGPLTAFQGRFSGTNFLIEPGALLGLGLRLGRNLELRAQGGVGFPYALHQGPRAMEAHGGVNLRWRR